VTGDEFGAPLVRTAPHIPAASAIKSADGIKFDTNKLEYTLLPMNAIEKVIRVLMYGSEKYEEFNWNKVNDRTKRYLNAAYRHMGAYLRGESVDQESKQEHLAHAVCSLLFILAESSNGDAKNKCGFNEEKKNGR